MKWFVKYCCPRRTWEQELAFSFLYKTFSHRSKILSIEIQPIGIDHVEFPECISSCGWPSLCQNRNAWWTRNSQKAGSEYDLRPWLYTKGNTPLCHYLYILVMTQWFFCLSFVVFFCVEFQFVGVVLFILNVT